ncbi:S-layer homology domain-containing protein [Paenibacillus tarimensis]
MIFIMSFPVLNIAAGDTVHWVEKELESYKQRIVEYKDGGNETGMVSEEEWKAFHSTVLNEELLDEPIEIMHWVTMINMGVKLPKDDEAGLIQSYVYDQVTTKNAGSIDRETAYGGLIKLLSLSIIDAGWNNNQMDAAGEYTDFDEISDRQSGLIRVAYREGLIDSATKDRFRPKALFTNAEAISVMEKVMLAYELSAPFITLKHDHWAYTEAKSFITSRKLTAEQLELIRDGLPGHSVPVSLWHDLLAAVIGFPPDKDGPEAQYTYGLAVGDYMPRDRAIASLMKLWGPSRDATDEERQAAAEAFTDYGMSFDPSKLAIAYSMGIVQGYKSRFYPDKDLTYGEMLVMLSRVTSFSAGAENKT